MSLRLSWPLRCLVVFYDASSVVRLHGFVWVILSGFDGWRRFFV